MSKTDSNKQLEALQFLGITTKIILMLISVVQGMIVIRLLSISEYGLVGIVLAVSSIVGVYQHLGLGIGTLREVASAKGNDAVSRVFSTSFFARLSITLPIAFILFLLADKIALNIYHRPEIIFGIKITAFVILANGIQEIGFNVLNGIQKFKFVFLLQILNSILNLILVVGFIYFWNYNGYFIGNLIATIIFCILFIIFTYLAMGRRIIFPKKSEFIEIFKSIFTIGLFIYLGKIFFGLFNQSGILIFGYFASNDEVGYLRFAITYGSYILAFSNAVNHINITIMTKKFLQDIDSFKRDFIENFNTFFYMTFFVITIMILFSKEIIQVLAGKPYLVVQPIVIISVFAFFVHMLFEILCGSVYISSKDLRGYLISYVILAAVSTLSIYLFVVLGFGKVGVLIGMLIGTFATLLFSIFRIWKMLNMWVFNHYALIIVVISIPCIIFGMINVGVWYRVALFIIYFAAFWYSTRKFKIFDLFEILKLSLVKVRKSLGKVT
ncbi:MAG: oligosaccharide flippase family protein [Actinobacteria bacterium]|nr:oligosaccharide flippase family protein [Actinomycetota bacterium]